MDGAHLDSRESWLGESTVAAQIRAQDWSHSVLGPIEQWPQSLRTALSICLHSSSPVALYWGPQFIALYNDVCAEILGAAHPDALGMRASDLFPEAWPQIGPIFERTLQEGCAAKFRDQRVPFVQANGFAEHRFDLTTTPVRREDGSIGGIIVFAFDVSQHALDSDLQHRTRNLLAVVRAIATQSFQPHLPENVLNAFTERLSSLGRVQGLLSRADNERVKLIDVVWAELEAYASNLRSRLEVHGPSVRLFHHQVQTIALTLHELVTNALKYGALHSPAGRLSVTWETWLGTHGQQRLALTWRESGVAMPPDAGQRRGQGRELIENSLRFSMQADTQLVFGNDGVWCRIELPVDAKKRPMSEPPGLRTHP
jgi:two-component sensor histidine kinase